MHAEAIKKWAFLGNESKSCEQKSSAMSTVPAAPATGLVPKGKDASLPLKNVSVEAKVRGFVMGLQSTLTYSNDTPYPVEVFLHLP